MSYRFYDALEHEMWLELSLDSDGYFGNVSLVQEGNTLWEFRLDAVSAGELYEAITESIKNNDILWETSIADSLGRTLCIAKEMTIVGKSAGKPIVSFSTDSIDDDICWLSLLSAKQLRTTLDEDVIENLNRL